MLWQNAAQRQGSTDRIEWARNIGETSSSILPGSIQIAGGAEEAVEQNTRTKMNTKIRESWRRIRNGERIASEAGFVDADCRCLLLKCSKLRNGAADA